MFGFGSLGELPLGIGPATPITAALKQTTIRSGVSFPSFTDVAAYAVVVGAADANYPVANLGNLASLRTVARAAAVGPFAVTLVLPAAEAIQFIGIIHHNAQNLETARVRLFSDNNPDPAGNAAHIVYDSDALRLLADDDIVPVGYAQTRPYVLDAAVTAQSARIDFAGNPNPWQIGAIEIGGWWAWGDVAIARSFGVTNKDIVFDAGLDVDQVTSVWSPRIVQGSRETITQDEIHTTALDFIREKMTSRPFVWVWNYNDPSTWAREVIAVLNNSLPLPVANEYPSAAFKFDFMEHMR